MRVGPHRWSRAYCPVRRYQGMTLNIVECMNNCLRYARQLPITTLVEYIRDMMQKWFHERRDAASKNTTQLSRWATEKLPKRMTIHISTRFCKKKLGDFCSDFYKTSTWLESYSSVIFLVGHPSEWNTPEEVRYEVVLPPEWRPQAGRPRKNRVPSAGEHGRRTRYCTICKKSGHNRQNCSNPSAGHLGNVPDPEIDPPPPRRRKCKSCGQEGYNIRTYIRTCPTRPYDNPTDPDNDVE
ncbi:hypothetical protein Dsin_008316 [Dipteronia sinensis]|uniref:CCHC-type domain-containing protein n=1 Tax=Dipteronia sinensis TaxID=43782 RepID=A0AAE0ANA7_9ROSI|nr:hypothetical protein Dsin_008316 [Dipteronia sinensis]